MADLTLDELVAAVAARTAGNRHDYLTVGDVEQVVTATLLELEAAGGGDELAVVVAGDEGRIDGMSETPETNPTPDEPTPAPAPPEPGDPGEPDPQPAE